MRSARWLLFLAALAIAVFAALWAATPASAAFTSPGNGQNYSMATLATAAPGTVAIGGPGCTYTIVDDVTISNFDTLNIAAGCALYFNTGIGMVIEGRLFVNGTAAQRVQFVPTVPVPSPGQYIGLQLNGAGFAPSQVNNLTVSYSVWGLRCGGCAGLEAHNITGNRISGDLIQVVAGARDVVVEDAFLNITAYAFQSVVAINASTNVSGRNATGPLAALSLLVWNSTNVSFTGPLSVTTGMIADVLIDNATNVSVSGAAGRNYPVGVRVSQSRSVALYGLSFNATPSPVTAADTVDLYIDGLAVENANGSGLIVVNVTGGVAANLSVRFSTVGINITGSSNFVLRDVNVSTTGSAIDLRRSSNMSGVNLSATSGGAAVIQLTNLSLSSFAQVNVSGGTAGLRIVNGSSVVVAGLVATSVFGPGVFINGSTGAVLLDCRVTGVQQAGLDVSGSDYVARNFTAVAGMAEGVRLTSSSGYLYNLTSSFNAGAGLVAVASATNIVAGELRNNGADGWTIFAGTAEGSALSVRNNGANGVSINNGGTGRLVDAQVENNTGFGVIVDSNGSRLNWEARGPGNSLANNPARIAGSVQVWFGGRLDVLNAAVRLVGNLSAPLWVDVQVGGTLWVDGVTIDRDSPADYFAITVLGSFTVLRSTIAHGWISASLGWIGLEGSTIQASQGPLFFNTSSRGRLANSSFVDSAAASVSLEAASDVVAQNLLIVRSGGPFAVKLENGSVWRIDNVSIANASAAALGVFNQSYAVGQWLNVSGSPGCALCLGSNSDADLIGGSLSTTGAQGAVFGLDMGDLRLLGVSFIAPLGAAMEVDGSASISITSSWALGVARGFTLVNATVVFLAGLHITAWGHAVRASASSGFFATGANWSASSGFVLEASGPGPLSLRNSVLLSSAQGASMYGAWNVSVSNTSFEVGDDATALDVYNVGAVQLGSLRFLIGNDSLALSLKSAPGQADGIDIEAGFSSSGIFAQQAVASLWNLTLRMGAGAFGVLADHADGSTVRSVDLVCGGGCSGASVSNSANVQIENLSVDAGMGGITGIGISNSPGLRLTNATIKNAFLSIIVDRTDGVFLENVSVSDAFDGLLATNDARVEARAMRTAGVTGSAVNATERSSVSLFDSILGASVRSLRAEDSSISLFDTLHTNSTFLLLGSGAAFVYWSLAIQVQSGSAPVAGANVTLTNVSGGPSLFVSDSGGLALAGYALEFAHHLDGRQYASPYIAAASLPSGISGQVSFDLDRPRLVNLTLADVEPPVLAARLQVRTTVGRLFAFGPISGDADNVAIVAYNWAFVNETGVLRSFASTTGAYTFSKPGHYLFAVTAFDASGNRNSTTFDVWVNAPPVFTVLPSAAELEGTVGFPIVFTVGAADPDPEDAGALTFNVSGEAEMSISGATFSWTPVQGGSFVFTLSVSDGWDQATISLGSIISAPGDPSNRLPVFTTEPPLEANLNRPYEYDVEVIDLDAGDTVILQLMNGTAGMTLQQFSHSSQAILSWTPSAYYQRGPDAFTVLINVSLRAWDTHGFTYQNFTIRLRNPPDEPPVIQDFTIRELAPGETITIDLRQFMSDVDDDPSSLRWSIRKGNETAGTLISFDTEDPYTVVIRAPDDFAGRRSFFITFVLTDPSGLNDTMTAEVVLVAPSLWDTILPWLLLIVIVGGAGATYALMTRQRGPLPMSSSPSGPPPGTSATTAPPPAAAAAADAGFPFLIEGAAVLGADGAVLAKAAVPDAALGETFGALPGAWRSARPTAAGFTVLKVAGKDAAGARASDGAVVVVGHFAADPSPWLGEPLQDAVTRLEAHGSGMGAVAGQPIVHEILRELLGLSAGATAASVAAYSAAQQLRIASVVEMVNGLVRLKVAVDNNTASLAADVRLSLDYDDKVLRLEHCEPTYETKREKLMLGNLRPKERKTVAFYFDPQICTRSLINATVAYDDAAGRFHSAAMKTRPVEVVCPAFSTPRRASTAMLKRLLREELAFRDSKYFRFPAETPASQVFEGGKRAVMAQDLQLVREFAQEAPFEAEAWFYGETKATKAPMVVWTTVFGQERVAQFSVASSSSAAITGLLAELGRRLVEGRGGGGVGAPIQSFARGKAEQELGERASLLSKSESGELESKDH